jgi:hypothetical protein
MGIDTIEKRKASHYAIFTDIEINASPEQVWEVLTDTGSYKDWAAFMVDLKGKIADGNTITASFQLNPQKPKLNTIDHKIHVTEGEAFFWAEKGPMGICDNHHFRVEPAEDGTTRFVQHDEIMKGMTWALGGMLSKMYLKGYQAFNASLKAEAERRAAL